MSSEPFVIATNPFDTDQIILFGIDTSYTGTLFATMWGGVARVTLNGVEIPIQGFSNTNVVTFNGYENDGEFGTPGAFGILGPSVRMYGNELNNAITGSRTTPNFINGFGGEDQIGGGSADDIFVYDGTADYFFGAGGSDTILAQLSYSLSANPAINLTMENIRLQGGYETAVSAVGDDGANKLEGNEFNNNLTGRGGDDQLYGYAGDDTLYGGAGRDRLFGNTGNDSLYGGVSVDHLAGGAGNDLLDGGAGSDWYRYFATSLNSGDVNAGEQDTIVNGAGDRVDFNAAFEALLNHAGGNLGTAELTSDVVINAAGFDTGGNVRFADGQLQIDLNNDGQYIATDDFAITLGGVTTVTYNAQGDYFLLG